MYYHQGERDWVEWLANEAYRSVIIFVYLKDAVLNHCYLTKTKKTGFLLRKVRSYSYIVIINPLKISSVFVEYLPRAWFFFIWSFGIFFFSCYDLSFGISCFCFWQLSFLALWKKQPPALPPELGTSGTDFEKLVVTPTICNLLMA